MMQEAIVAAPQAVKPSAKANIIRFVSARLTPTSISSALSRSIILMVLAITLIAFIGTLRYGFVYDDGEQIVGNRYIQSWQFLPRFFTEHVWAHMSSNSTGTYYRPVFLLWLLINHTMFGLNPMGWHVTTVALHIVVTFTVYLLAQRLTKDRLTASVAAVLFGLHPAHVEAVSWVSGVTEPLLAVLLMPSFLCYLKKREQAQKPRLWMIASLMLYTLAMLAKETALVLPMIIFAHEWLFGQSPLPVTPSTRWRALFQKPFLSAAPYLVLTAFYLIARMIVLKGFGSALTPLPFSTMALTWPYVLWFYIKLMIFPVGLSVLYDTQYVTSPNLANFFFPLTGVVAATIVLWWASRRSRTLKFAVVWMILPILPVLKLSAFYWGEIAHDRYLYLPSIGFSIIVAVALRQINIGRAKLLGQPLIQVLTVLIVACLLRQATAYQNPYWADNLELYTRGVQIAPNNILAKSNLGTTLSRLGRYDEAVKLHRAALETNPNYWLALYNLGYCYYKLGKFEMAEQYLMRAIEINPTESRQFLGLGLVRMGTSQLSDAAIAIRHAIKLKPEASTYHYELGTLLKKQGDLMGALKEFNSELVIDPQNKSALQQVAEIEGVLHSSAHGNPPGPGESNNNTADGSN